MTAPMMLFARSVWPKITHESTKLAICRRVIMSVNTMGPNSLMVYTTKRCPDAGEGSRERRDREAK
jgi:hypothetical protein